MATGLSWLVSALNKERKVKQVQFTLIQPALPAVPSSLPVRGHKVKIKGKDRIDEALKLAGFHCGRRVFSFNILQEN